MRSEMSSQPFESAEENSHKDEEEDCLRFLSAADLRLFLVRRFGAIRQCRAHSFLTGDDCRLIRRSLFRPKESPEKIDESGSNFQSSVEPAENEIEAKSQEKPAETVEVEQSDAVAIKQFTTNCKLWTADELGERFDAIFGADSETKPDLSTLKVQLVESASDENLGSTDHQLSEVCDSLGIGLLGQRPEQMAFAAGDPAVTAIKTQLLCHVLGHLQLLLNCRDELSTARALLCLKPDAFHVLKQQAVETKMPMCQTAISYVERNRLGGSHTQTHEQMNQHCKVYSQFVDTINHLHEIIEEQPQPDVSIPKLLGWLQRRIGEQLIGRQHQQLLGEVMQWLQSCHLPRVLHNLSTLNRTAAATPQLTQSKGGSRLGRANLRAIECLLDTVNCYRELFLPDEISSLAADAGSSTPDKSAQQHIKPLPFVQPELLFAWRPPVPTSPAVEKKSEEQKQQEDSQSQKTPTVDPEASSSRFSFATFLCDRTPLESAAGVGAPTTFAELKNQNETQQQQLVRSPAALRETQVTTTPQANKRHSTGSVKRKQLLREIGEDEEGSKNVKPDESETAPSKKAKKSTTTTAAAAKKAPTKANKAKMNKTKSLPTGQMTLFKFVSKQ